ncbi:MAG: RNA polymerase sigma factor [Thermonemataceae bacterium]
MVNPILNDSALVAMYASGNERALEELIEKHRGKILGIINQIVKDEDEAKDILQETLIKAITKIKQGRYNEEGKFFPWIARIAHNLAIDCFRKDRRYPTTELEDNKQVTNSLDFSEASIEAAQIRKEVHQKLRNLIQTLPEKQKEVLMMRHYYSMSFQEIAQATNVSINTALGRMRYALINLRKEAERHHLQLGEYLQTCQSS